MEDRRILTAWLKRIARHCIDKRRPRERRGDGSKEINNFKHFLSKRLIEINRRLEMEKIYFALEKNREYNRLEIKKLGRGRIF